MIKHRLVFNVLFAFYCLSPQSAFALGEHPRFFLNAGTPAAVDQQIRNEGEGPLKKLVSRNRDKAVWLLNNSIFAFSRDPQMRAKAYSVSTTNYPRFNGRRCLRIMTESILAYRLEGVQGNELTAEQLRGLRALALQEYRFAVYRRPHDWYVPFSASSPNTNALENAEFSACIAIGYDWLYESLNAEERVQGINALNLALRRYREQHATLFTPTSVQSHSNWNAVINSAAVLAALAIEGDVANNETQANLVSIFNLAKSTLPAYYGLFGQHGSYPEGPSYITYSLEFLGLTDAALKQLGLESLGAETHPNILEAASFVRDVISPISPLLQPGSTDDRVLAFNFSDAAVGVKPSLAVSSWLGRWHDRLDAAAFAQTIGAVRVGDEALSSFNFGAMDAFSVLWYKPGAGSLSAPVSRLYGDDDGENNIAFLQLTSESGVQLSGMLKGGRPSKTPHGHLDSGSFVIDALGRRWASDPGPESYSASGYFNASNQQGARRWQYLRANNLGHNTLNLSQTIQEPTAKTKLTLAPLNNDLTAVADLRSAYGSRYDSLSRGLTLTRAGAFQVRDTVTGPMDQNMEWRMIYCNQSRLGVPVIPLRNECRIPASESPVKVLTPNTARISEEATNPITIQVRDVNHPGQTIGRSFDCHAKYLDVRLVTAPEGAVMRTFPFDSGLPENTAVIDSTASVTQVANPGCYVLSVKVPPQASRSFELLLEMTPHQN